MAFYRIYRPQRIEEIDNAHVRDQLYSLLSKKRSELPHAFFFSGPKGTGKTTAARLIAKLFLCEKLDKTGPCGTCAACTSVAGGSALDVIEIDAASNRGIDEIRALKDGIGLAPSMGDFKVYIIDEVHMLTNEAFNALLKTLEEPPTHAVFVLATTDPQKVPSTILSRCVHIKFARAGKKELVTVIQRIAKKEKLTFTDEIIDLIANVADGSFRDAVKLLEQVSFSKPSATIDEVRALLSVSDQSTKELFLTALLEKNAKEALSIINRLTREGADIKQFTTDVLYSFEEQLVTIASDGASDTMWKQEALLFMIDELLHAYSTFRYTPILSLSLEVAVVNICVSKSALPVVSQQPMQHIVTDAQKNPPQIAQVLVVPPNTSVKSLGLLTHERLVEHWSDVIAAAKPLNHSIAGVLRSSRPHSVESGVVTIEAFYPFHQEKLSEPNVRFMLSNLMKQLFGEKVTVEIVLGKK
ncbi:MAG: DNA polymerase III subunit gamma/tau [Patescibacteria group bacterium]